MKVKKALGGTFQTFLEMDAGWRKKLWEAHFRPPLKLMLGVVRAKGGRKSAMAGKWTHLTYNRLTQRETLMCRK